MHRLIVDARELLRPIPGTRGGAGCDLRDDADWTSPYQRLRTARNDARSAERENDHSTDPWIRSAVPTHWNTVVEASLACFARSRDFDVACWLAEALSRLHGVAGFAAGIDLLTGLCDRYWDAGFPVALPPEEATGGAEWEDRESPILNLFGDASLGTVLRHLWLRPLYEAASGPVSLHHLCRELGLPAYRELDAPVAARRTAPDASYATEEARAAIALLQVESPMLRAAAGRLEARLARHLPATAASVMPKIADFDEAVRDIAEIIGAPEAPQRHYC
ncbi:type VI secretion system ImpA family N-terminal domain-containing protein [Roseomonas sp. HJA6]|uniref:Type VI secretion system ImpA family N-terminal domain-containing protein n=1 Tax=Roseomonas alba TaxID=2846776 RepID=A0ABS7A5I1_9PROT|nr:type VI secretion system ImpA family N-terminal domain-containing protein [Neoroseomonas alba]MBW6397350.1 type VI secretion system ImpA family N-terminal domain-containing protein [Neoroseomonas alba]